MRRLALTVLTILLLFSDCFAIGKFKYYTMDNGLPSNIVYSLSQDSDGVVWAGTELGLCWGNGREFTQCTEAGGRKVITSIFSICDIPWADEVWVGVAEGLYSVRKTDRTMSRITGDGTDACPDGVPVTRIVTDPDRNVWVGTYGAGLYRFNSSTGKWIRYAGVSEGHIISDILITSDYEVWIADANYIYKYNTSSDSLERVFISERFTKEELSKASLLCQDTYRNLWICDTYGCLWRFDRKDTRATRYELGAQGVSIIPRAMLEYSPGVIAVGTNSGLVFYDSAQRQFSRIYGEGQNDYGKLNDRFIHSMMKDVHGGLWIGTYFGGINFCSQKACLVESVYPPQDCGHIISSMSELSDGRVLVGSDDGGLSIYNPYDGTYSRWDKEFNRENLNVRAILVENDFVWIGTYHHGLYKYDISTGKCKNYNYEDVPGSRDVYSFYRDDKGQLWAGTKRGLSIYDEENDRFTRVMSLNNNSNISGIVQEGPLFYLASDESGLLKFNPEDGTCSRVSGNYPDNVRAVTVFNDSLYVGTSQGVFIKSGESLTACHGYFLESCQVFGMIAEYSGIWITTDNGLIQYDAAGNETQFTEEDGFLDGHFSNNSIAKLSSGKILTGGTRGINAFMPTALKNNDTPENVRVAIMGIDEIQPDSGLKPLDPNGRLRIRSERACIAVKFVAINYESQKKNIYRYRLKGHNDGWCEATDEEVRNGVVFSGITPGKYRFEVAAAGMKGMDFGDVSQVEITVARPLADKARLLLMSVSLLALVLVLIWLAYKNRARKAILDSYMKKTANFAVNSLIMNNIAKDIQGLVRQPGFGDSPRPDTETVLKEISGRLSVYSQISGNPGQSTVLARASECVQNVCQICENRAGGGLDIHLSASYSGIADAMVNATPFIQNLLSAIEAMTEYGRKDIHIETVATKEEVSVRLWSLLAEQKIEKSFACPVSSIDTSLDNAPDTGDNPGAVLADSSTDASLSVSGQSLESICKQNRFSGEFYDLVISHISDTDLSIEMLASEMKVSRTTLFNRIRTQTGVTPNLLIRRIRLEKAAELLRESDMRISEVYEQTGFVSWSYFSKLFREEFGVAPKDYCDKG